LLLLFEFQYGLENFSEKIFEKGSVEAPEDDSEEVVEESKDDERDEDGGIVVDAVNGIFWTIREPIDGEGVVIELELIVGKELPNDDVSIANGILTSVIFGRLLIGGDCVIAAAGNVGKLSANEVLKADEDDVEEGSVDDHSDIDVIVGTTTGLDEESICLMVGSTTNVAV
jgi:hypothetical protein